MREADNGPGSHWLDPGRVVVGLQSGFEVVGTDGRVLASHAGTVARPDTGAGAVSITASPDGRLLAFLDWTTDIELEVYLLDMETGDTSVVGPASLP